MCCGGGLGTGTLIERSSSSRVRARGISQLHRSGRSRGAAASTAATAWRCATWRRVPILVRSSPSAARSAPGAVAAAVASPAAWSPPRRAIADPMRPVAVPRRTVGPRSPRRPPWCAWSTATPWWPRAGGRAERVRLIGIDTPETVSPTKPVQCYGKQASDHLKALLPPGTAVTPGHRRRDPRRLRTAPGLRVPPPPTGCSSTSSWPSDGYASLLTFPPNVAHEPQFSARRRRRPPAAPRAVGHLRWAGGAAGRRPVRPRPGMPGPGG